MLASGHIIFVVCTCSVLQREVASIWLRCATVSSKLDVHLAYRVVFRTDNTKNKSEKKSTMNAALLNYSRDKYLVLRARPCMQVRARWCCECALIYVDIHSAAGGQVIFNRLLVRINAIMSLRSSRPPPHAYGYHAWRAVLCMTNSVTAGTWTAPSNQ